VQRRRRRRRRRRKYLIGLQKKHLILRWIICSVVVAIVTGEIFARFYLGLGTPPLSIKHPTIEYMYKPNQDVYRFGNHFVINQYGMRSAPFTRNKQKGEFRIMVVGDSVINGGGQTDAADLATSLIRSSLANSGYKQPIVGNISAGSWGPGNWLAYAKEYGFFDADLIVLVLSSHDYADNPTFEPLNPNTHPTEQPVSALVEGIERYLPRYLPRSSSTPIVIENDYPSDSVDEAGGGKGIADLQDFLKLAKQQTSNVLVFQNFEYIEIQSIGYQRIRAACKQLNISPISLAPYFRTSLDRGVNPYRDNIHPNQIGQQIIAQAIIVNLPSSNIPRRPIPLR
jgi:lysophospholipase L1-like esterase